MRTACALHTMHACTQALVAEEGEVLQLEDLVPSAEPLVKGPRGEVCTNVHACVHIRTSLSSRGQEGRAVLTYMHVYKRTYVRTYIQVLTAEEQSTYMHAYMHARIHACMPTLMHACMHTYIGLDGDRAESRTLRTPDRPPAKEPRGRTLPWRPVLQEAKLLREEKVVCESGEGCVGRARGWRWMGDSLYNTQCHRSSAALIK